MNYAVLMSNDDVFIIFNDKIIEDKIGNIEKIKKVQFINNNVVIFADTEIFVPIINIEDRKMLSKKESYVSILNRSGEAIKIFEIKMGV